MRARNRSENTIYSYLLSVRLLSEFVGPAKVDGLTKVDVEAFIAHQLATGSPSTAGIRYRSLRQFFSWLLDEGEIDVDPMAHMDHPFIPPTPVPIVPDETIHKLVAACDGRGFGERRDSAILRLFIDTPCRISEITNLELADVDLDAYTIVVTAKGSRKGVKPFGPKSSVALDRYLRVRNGHKYAESSRLWLGPKGPMTRSGVAQMLERRCIQAGVPHLHWHQFRHTWAHTWLADGGQEGDLMRLAGWSSPAMVRKYGASMAEERARVAYREQNPGDRI